MSDYKALVVWGGWDGHEPKHVAEILEKSLVDRGVSVEVSDSLDALLDPLKLKALNLIVPVWTMGTITSEQYAGLSDAVVSGVGIGGIHGGMCDSFRDNTEYQFMTGGQFVAHPGNDGTEYMVRVTHPEHFIMQGAPAEFPIKSEQYYMHVDPAIKVLATTRFPVADGPHVGNGDVDMPVVWTKTYGQGRVFYNSLGHNAAIVAMPTVLELTTRGLLWAARAEALAE